MWLLSLQESWDTPHPAHLSGTDVTSKGNCAENWFLCRAESFKKINCFHNRTLKGQCLPSM